MSWVLYSLISAVFASASAIVEKKTLFREHALEFSAALALTNAIITLPMLFFVGVSTFAPVSFLLLALNSIAASVAFLLVTKGLRHMEVSVASPLLVLGPGATAILAFIFLGEELTRFQASGIIFMIVGAYILQTHKFGGLLEPIRIFWNSKYVHYILGAVVIYAFAGVLDRLLLSRYGIDPRAYLSVAHIIIAISFLCMLKIFHGDLREVHKAFRDGGWMIVGVAILTTGYRFADTLAIQIAPVGLVGSVKKLSALFTTIIGGELFHEENILRKAFACVVMLVGVAMIVS